MCGAYVSLDTVCETGMVVHISGLSPKESWIEKKLDIPNAKQGYLIAQFDEPPMKGIGINYDRSWNTYYDDGNKFICIGDYHTNDNDDCIEFANNIIAVIRGTHLIAIWAKIREVEVAP